MKLVFRASLVLIAFYAFVLAFACNHRVAYYEPIVPDIESDRLDMLLKFSDVDRLAQEPDVCEDYENELIEQDLIDNATKIDDCTVTHYCSEKYPHICGNGDGLTANGKPARPGIVAVDPNVIPYGASVMVDYGDGNIQYYIAADCGSAIKGSHIDVCVESHKEAVSLGVKTATVYWLMECVE